MKVYFLINGAVLKQEYLTDFVRHHALLTPDKKALVFEGKSYSWQILTLGMSSIAGSLSAYLDAKQQQVVAIMAPNSFDFIVSYLAVLELGHIVMPIDANYKKMEVEAICSQIKPDLIVTTRKLAGAFGNPSSKLLITEDLIKKNSVNKYNTLRIGADTQIASLLFTSGTTGRPKAAPYTHANHLWNIKTSSGLWNWTGEDTLLVTLPLSHWYGLVMGLSGAIYHGNTIYLHEYPNNTKTLEALASGEITIFPQVAGVFSKMTLRETSAAYDLSPVRLFISGGAPLPPIVWEKFKQIFGHEIIEAYGSSETGRIASNSLSSRQKGSPGKPLPGVEVNLSKDGELLVKSPGLFPGYYKNKAKTREKLTADGWWRTGDIAEIKNGYIYLRSRSIERINKNGYSIYPRDIEWVLLKQPTIDEALVLGLQESELVSDKIIYFIVGQTNKKEVLAHSRLNMPSSWLPDKIFVLPELPRTKSGKPELAKLRALAA